MSVNSALVSYPDCPNHCTNGQLYDPWHGLYTPCPYCEEKRKSAIRDLDTVNDGKNIYEILRVTQPLTGLDFNIQRMIPDFAVKYITEESLLEVEKELLTLMKYATLGEVVESSLLFNLGKKVYHNEFIIPFMLKSYENGLKVTPVLDAITLCKLRYEFEKYGFNYAPSQTWGDSYSDYLSSDVCVVVIDTGITQSGLDSIKGLMQLRADKNKATIIFTNSWGSRVLDLCIEDNSYSKYLAHLVSVEYTNSRYKTEDIDSEESNFKRTVDNTSTTRDNGFGTKRASSNSMTQEAFKNLVKPKDNLL